MQISTNVCQWQPCQWLLGDTLTSIQPFLLLIPSASISGGGFICFLRRHDWRTHSGYTERSRRQQRLSKASESRIVSWLLSRLAKNRGYRKYKSPLKFISKRRLHVNPEEILPAMLKFDKPQKSQRPLVSGMFSLATYRIWPLFCHCHSSWLEWRCKKTVTTKDWSNWFKNKLALYTNKANWFPHPTPEKRVTLECI